MKVREKILELKKKKNAVILAHNYQPPEVQEIADYSGDSLGLSMRASRTEAATVIFCGVYFMAETAKILSPEKTVLIPESTSGCPMADMITAAGLKEMKAKHPQAKVLCYVNTPAEVKAEADYCCTSANAVKMAREAFSCEEEIIFVPDKYLGDYVMRQTGRKFLLWDGYCPVHAEITVRDIEKQRELHPQALVLVHPECTPKVIALAEGVFSTEGICRYVNKSIEREFIIGTEPGIIYRLKKENPQKEFYPANDSAICEDMKKTSLEKVLCSLEEGKHEIFLETEVGLGAKRSIDRMLNFRE